MRKFRWAAASLCLAIALCAALTGCASGGAVVATVGGDAITQQDLKMYANYVLMQEMQDGTTIGDINDAEFLKQVYQYALDTAVMHKVMVKKATEKKLYPLSQTDSKDIDDTINQSLTDQLQTLADKYTQEAANDKTINPDAEARKELAATMKKTGLTKEKLTLLYRYDKVTSDLAQESTKDVAVTDADLQASYSEKLAQQQKDFAADPAQYESAQANGSPVVLYKPGGYRYVKHILIAFPQDTADAITAAQTAGDTAKAAQLRTDALKLIQAKAEEVLAKVNAGGDFNSLISEYGEDPGMQQEPASVTGYELGPATNSVTEFKDAALKLGRIGDVTGLVASDFGYHIIKWVGDVPSGPVALADVKQALSNELLQEKQNAAWLAYLDQLKAEYKVAEHPELFPTMDPVPSEAPAASPAA
jgi:peptidyl-prolyl cis-trans isomerase C